MKQMQKDMSRRNKSSIAVSPEKTKEQEEKEAEELKKQKEQEEADAKKLIVNIRRKSCCCGFCGYLQPNRGHYQIMLDKDLDPWKY